MNINFRKIIKLNFYLFESSFFKGKKCTSFTYFLGKETYISKNKKYIKFMKKPNKLLQSKILPD